MKQVFYVPERGDVVWITLSRKSGRSRASERRPAVVLSPQTYNSRVGLAVVCPITAHIKSYPFEVLLPAGLPVAGTILADQAGTLDWRVHRAERICSLAPEVIDEALGKLRSLLG
jgi:mRNA interferase MazF